MPELEWGGGGGGESLSTCRALGFEFLPTLGNLTKSLGPRVETFTFFFASRKGTKLRHHLCSEVIFDLILTVVWDPEVGIMTKYSPERFNAPHVPVVPHPSLLTLTDV